MVDEFDDTPETRTATDAATGDNAGRRAAAVAESPEGAWSARVYDQFWTQAAQNQRYATLGVLLAMLVGVGALVYTAATAPSWNTLVKGMEPEDQQAAINALQAKAIPYKLASMGTILVADERLHEARLEVAASNMPSGRSVGFELFDKSELGRSTFAEKVNYHRALEGEIARTIQHMATVQRARIHLVLPERRLFVEDEITPTASVQLTLKNGVALTRRQVMAIRQLVASGVERLEPEHVSVVDQKGIMLAGPEDEGWDDEESMSALKIQTKMESNIERRVMRLLEPVFGEGNVRAQVAVELDFSRVTETEETYNPESQVIRSEREKNETSETQTNIAQGAPGTPTNVPDRAQAAASNSPATIPASTQRLDHIKNYEIDKRTRRSESPHARVKRLSVGVIVHNLTDEQGAVGVSEAEIERYRSLVAKAVGIDANRGDQVEVVAMPFWDAEPVVRPVAPAFYTEPVFVGSTILGLAVLMIGLGLWLFTRRRQRKAEAALIASHEAEARRLEAELEAARVEAEEAGEQYLIDLHEPAPSQKELEQRILSLRARAIGLSEEDLSQVALVVERWLNPPITADEEEEAA
jgi:flagellar M-ring protein FliF